MGWKPLVSQPFLLPETQRTCMMHKPLETSHSITQWGNDTFGPAPDLLALVKRADLEL